MRELKLTFTKPFRGAVEVDSNVDLHQRSADFIVYPTRTGYSPDKRDNPLLTSILQQLCNTSGINELGIRHIHVNTRRITIFHKHSVEPTTIRDNVVEVLPIHNEDYVFESDFTNSN